MTEFAIAVAMLASVQGWNVAAHHKSPAEPYLAMAFCLLLGMFVATLLSRVIGWVW